MKYYLDEDPSNIVAVHCLAGTPDTRVARSVWPQCTLTRLYHSRMSAGRGRTGTVISAFLLHIGLFNDATEALRYFANTRSSKGCVPVRPFLAWWGTGLEDFIAALDGLLF
jgi:hypothetical protein